MRIEMINPQPLARLLMVFGLLVFANAPAGPNDFDLHQAVLDDDIQLVTRLLNKGVTIDIIGSRKYGYGSALHLAVREGHVDIAQVLIDRGAEVDVLDPDDLTPLHNAAWNGNLDMAKLLLDAGANLHASTYDGDTPLSLAKQNNRNEVAAFFEARLRPSIILAKPSQEKATVDFSGAYLVDVSGEPKFIEYILSGARLEDRPVFEVVQKGDRITVTTSGAKFSGFYGPIFASLDGNTVNLKWVDARARMIVKPGGKELVGTVIYTGGDNIRNNAELKLTKIESDAVPIPDISGTYISETTNSGVASLAAGSQPVRLIKNADGKLITIKQTGNTITGSDSSKTFKINGTREGNIINFYIVLGNEIIGSWEINADATNLEGKWFTNGGGGASGMWNLTRVK
jgi:hypothetical protein